jgi:hypothetical protein
MDSVSDGGEAIIFHCCDFAEVVYTVDWYESRRMNQIVVPKSRKEREW